MNIGAFNRVKEQQIFKNNELVKTYQEPVDKRSRAANRFSNYVSTQGTIKTEEQMEEQRKEQGESTEWGAPNITKDMLIDPVTGKQKPLKDVYAALDPILTGITGEELVSHIEDLFAKYEGVPEEEKAHAKEAYKDAVYGLQPKPGQAVTPTAGGMGMRGKITGQQDIAQKFGRAGEMYAQDLYGLEKTATGAFEADVVGAIGDMDTPFAPSGGQTYVDPDYFARSGGRVPSANKKEETFLDFLTQLPDAGGM
jgi:hypothetical protein